VAKLTVSGVECNQKNEIIRNLPQHRETAITPVLEKALKRRSEEDPESQLDIEPVRR
jgi:hypothetical protein